MAVVAAVLPVIMAAVGIEAAIRPRVSGQMFLPDVPWRRRFIISHSKWLVAVRNTP